MVTLPDGMKRRCCEYWLRRPRRAGPFRSTVAMSSKVPFVRRKSFRISAIAAGLLASGVALADAHLDPQLVQKLAAATPLDELQVVVSFEQSGPVTATQVAALK